MRRPMLCSLLMSVTFLFFAFLSTGCTEKKKLQKPPKKKKWDQIKKGEIVE